MAAKTRPPKSLNYADFRDFSFSVSDISAVLARVGPKFPVADLERLRVDLSNDFFSFITSRANSPVYSVATRNSIDRLSKAASKTKRLYGEALDSHFQNTWLLNKVWATWPNNDAGQILQSIRLSLANLDLLLKAPDARNLAFGMSLEVQFIGITLPHTFEQHFQRPYGASRNRDLFGPGITFVLACLEQKRILNSAGRPFSPETIIAHRKVAMKRIRKNPHLAVARSLFMVVSKQK